MHFQLWAGDFGLAVGETNFTNYSPTGLAPYQNQVVTRMCDKAIMIYFCKGIADTAMEAGDSVNADMGCVDYHNLALGASSTVIQFASALRELPFSKV
jgi:hypothetical protein